MEIYGDTAAILSDTWRLVGDNNPARCRHRAHSGHGAPNSGPTTLDGSLGCKKAEIFGDIEEIYVDIAAIKGDIQRIFRQTKSP